jgi:hypothetical protein
MKLEIYRERERERERNDYFDAYIRTGTQIIEGNILGSEE